MKLTMAIALIAGMSIVGCGGKNNTPQDSPKVSAAPGASDSATNPQASSSPATGQESAGVRTYTFHGIPSNIDDASGMITVKHEEIKGYSPQGEATYKVANPDILKQVTVGKETHFTIRVAGDQVLVTKVQDGHDHADEHPKQ